MYLAKNGVLRNIVIAGPWRDGYCLTGMLRLPTIPQYYQTKELPSASNIRDGLRNIRLSTTRRRPASLPHFAPMSWGRMYLDCRVSRGFLWFLSRTGQILGTTIWFFSFQWVSRATRKDIERGQDASDKEAVSIFFTLNVQSQNISLYRGPS